MVGKTLKELREELAPCIEKGDLDVCVDQAARLAQEMGIAAKELHRLSTEAGRDDLYVYAYVLALAAAENLDGAEKARAYCKAGTAAQYIRKLKDSEIFYKKAIELDSEYVTARNNYAVLLQVLGREEEAENQYKKAVELDPKDATVHNNYATLLQDFGRNDEAEDQYKKAIQYCPEFVDAHVNYAVLLKQSSRFSEAETEARIALQIDQLDSSALGTLADILADEGYFKEAEGKYRATLRRLPDSTDNPTKSGIHNNLGWVYTKLKQYTDAELEFKKAVVLDPLNVKAIRNIRKIEIIKGLPEISAVQKTFAFGVVVFIILTLYLFWISKLSDTLYVSQSTFLIALMAFVLLFHDLQRFKMGPVEFEKSTEYREAKSQLIFEK